MKIGKLNVGEQVVCNDLDDAKIFNVVSVDKHVVGLTYELADGTQTKVTTCDCSLLQYPNKRQLAQV